jgi:hypothetical protein
MFAAFDEGVGYKYTSKRYSDGKKKKKKKKKN